MPQHSDNHCNAAKTSTICFKCAVLSTSADSIYNYLDCFVKQLLFPSMSKLNCCLIFTIIYYFNIFCQQLKEQHSPLQKVWTLRLTHNYILTDEHSVYVYISLAIYSDTSRGLCWLHRAKLKPGPGIQAHITIRKLYMDLNHILLGTTITLSKLYPFHILCTIFPGCYHSSDN